MLSSKELAVSMQLSRRDSGTGSGVQSDASIRVMNHNDLVVENEMKFLNACRYESKSKYLYDRPVTMGSCDTDDSSLAAQSSYTIILPDGNRYFLKARNKNTSASSDSFVTSSGNLLSKSMDEIAREADAIKVNILAKKTLSESKIHVSDSGKYHSTMMDSDDYRPGDDLEDIVHKNKLVESGLWVDKYAPRSFAQLLSPEKINREVLRALKLWDTYVFREKTATTSSSNSNSAPIGDGNGRSSHDMDIDEMANDEDNDDDDGGDRVTPMVNDKIGAVTAKDIRPQYKIILLCGPPGTGKTTLAHCVAKQCGYRPFEVNASDDRSAAILKDTLARAMHGNTIVGERRPNCIILDEIDGIDGKHSIDALLAIVKAPLNSKTNKGKRRTESLALTRPLICICNDEYSPALRELKNLSIRFRFTPPTEARLVQRLKAVCSIEGLNTNTNSLTTLCSATGNDIRSSINTLQFASMRARELISKKDVRNTMAVGEVLSSMICSGLKDEHKDILQVWREIFSRKEIEAIIYQKKQRLLGQYGQDHIVNTNRSGKGVRVLDPCMEVVQSTIDHGDLALVLSGIHENIYNIPFSDPNMSRLQRALDWLSMSDNLNTFTMTNPDGFQVLGYVAPTAGAIHCLCAVDSNVKVDWPKIDKLNYHKTQQKLSILNSLRESKATSVLSNRTLIALDSISYILDLINPKFRQSFSVSHSLSKAERQQLHDVVQIMYACGLSYNTSKVIDSTSITNTFHQQASLQIEPPISELVKYCTTENIVCDELASRRVYLHQEIRNMVRADLRKYVISVKGDGADMMDTTVTSPSNSSPSFKRKADTAAKDAAKQVLAELDESNEKRLRISRMDFFCKPKESKGLGNDTRGVNSENSSQVNRDKTGVQFKYNQGFSNAVRRPVSISEFIY